MSGPSDAGGRSERGAEAPAGALPALKRLLVELSPTRRIQLHLTFLLMVVGGIAEMVSLGAVLAFLGLLAGAETGSGARMAAIFYSIGFPRDSDPLLPAVGVLVLAGLLATVVRLVLAWVSQKFVLRIGHDLGVNIYSRMLRQPYILAVRRNSSEVLAGVEKVRIVIFAVLLPIMQAAVAAVVAIFIIAALLAIDIVAASLAAISIAVPYALVSLATRRILRLNSETLAVKQTQRVKQVQEGLGGLRDIIIDQSQGVFEESFRKIDDTYFRAQSLNVFVAAAPRYIVEFAGIILIALMAALMSSQPGGIVAAIPVLGAMALGAQRLLPLFQQIYYGWSSLTGSGQIIRDIVALLHAPVSTVARRDRRATVTPFQHDLVLENVSFRYPCADADALRNVNLRIARGDRIGFLGETGSGKSTLLDIIMGLLQPTHGEIRLDGKRLDDSNVAAWQSQIAHVPQTIYLTDSSIAENIAFGETAEEIDMDRVRAAADQAQIATFVESLPEGYSTETGERGVLLSGGQRQRIGIARALYKKANVLILDEATSALDDGTEAAIMAALERCDRRTTLLMIAHRLSTLADCDRIIRVHGGEIVEESIYAEIVRRNRPPGLAIINRE